jgi:hypothetical protein
LKLIEYLKNKEQLSERDYHGTWREVYAGKNGVKD